jgi:hypothetical protein
VHPAPEVLPIRDRGRNDAALVPGAPVEAYGHGCVSVRAHRPDGGERERGSAAHPLRAAIDDAVDGTRHAEARDVDEGLARCLAAFGRDLDDAEVERSRFGFYQASDGAEEIRSKAESPTKIASGARRDEPERRSGKRVSRPVEVRLADLVQGPIATHDGDDVDAVVPRPAREHGRVTRGASRRHVMLDSRSGQGPAKIGNLTPRRARTGLGVHDNANFHDQD